MSNTVAYIFKAIDQYTAVGKRIAKNNKLVAESAKRAKKWIDKYSVAINKARIRAIAFGKTLDKLRGQLNSTATKSLAAAGTIGAAFVAITAGGKYQDAMAELSAITGATGNDLEFFGNQGREMAKKFGIAQEVVVKSITDIASAKSELLKDPKGLTTIANQALILSKAAGIPLASAVDASVGALNQFNVGADQAARFVNVLAAGSKVGAAQVNLIVESMKNVGPVAAAFNVSFEQTNAILQVLAKNGVKGAEAGTALRAMLSKMEKFKGGKFAPSKIGFVESLQKIKDLGLSNNQVIKEFGEENLRSVLILRKKIPLIKQWTKEVTGTNVAQDQANLRMNTFNEKAKRLWVTLKDKLIAVFIGLEPMLSRMMVGFTKWMDSIDNRRLETFGKFIGGIVFILGETIDLVGKAISGFSMLAETIGEVAAAVAALDFSQFDLGAIWTPEIGGTQAKLAEGMMSADDAYAIINARESAAAAKSSLPAVGNMAKQSNALSERLTNPAGQAVNPVRADVNVNLNAPQGVVNSVKTRTAGKTSGLNLGINMNEEL